MANFLDNKLREDLERLKKIRYADTKPDLLSDQLPMDSILSGLTVVYVTIGVCVFVDSIPRPLVAEAEPLVSPRRSNLHRIIL